MKGFVKTAVITAAAFGIPMGIIAGIVVGRRIRARRGSIKLSGKEYFRIRQGDYRIIYEIIEERVVIVVIKIGHRRDVNK